MLAMGPASARSGDWQVPVLPTCALSGDGVVALRDAIDAHRAALDASGAMAARRADINERRLLARRRGDPARRVRRGSATAGSRSSLAQLDARALGPHAAAKRLLADIRTGEDA